jgi:hypothetical protein
MDCSWPAAPCGAVGTDVLKTVSVFWGLFLCVLAPGNLWLESECQIFLTFDEADRDSQIAFMLATGALAASDALVCITGRPAFARQRIKSALLRSVASALTIQELLAAKAGP